MLHDKVLGWSVGAVALVIAAVLNFATGNSALGAAFVAVAAVFLILAVKARRDRARPTRD